jgi:hypothetical protein
MKTTSTLKISAVKAILRNTFLAVLVLPVAPAMAANNCHVYEVTVQGTTSIGEGGSTLASQQFSVVQYAAWRETGFNGHPFEFVLTPGQDLNASPKVALIELGTNTRCQQCRHSCRGIQSDDRQHSEWRRSLPVGQRRKLPVAVIQCIRRPWL